MSAPLMPKATAVWLVENTALSFEQIADFCGVHALEVQGIADGEVAIGIVGLDREYEQTPAIVCLGLHLPGATLRAVTLDADLLD